MNSSPTMTAVVARTAGDPDVLEPATVSIPEPGPTEIRVAVHAAGVNPVDWKRRRTGNLGDDVILGWDVSGVVEAVGPGASLYSVGDEVFGMPRFPHVGGGYAEYVVAPSRHFAPKPATLSHVQAAVLPLVGLTSWQGLIEVAEVGAGDRVLIHAAAGGLGHVALQLAKARGAYVIGTASSQKHELLQDLGVDELIDYRSTDFATAVADVDVVFDTIGGEYGQRSLNVLRDGGRLVTIVAGGEDALAAAAAPRNISVGWTLVEPDRLGLLELTRLVDAGQLKPVIAQVFPLDQAAQAHAVGETNRTTGKLVLQVP